MELGCRFNENTIDKILKIEEINDNIDLIIEDTLNAEFGDISGLFDSVYPVGVVYTKSVMKYSDKKLENISAKINDVVDRTVNERFNEYLEYKFAWGEVAYSSYLSDNIAKFVETWNSVTSKHKWMRILTKEEYNEILIDMLRKGDYDSVRTSLSEILQRKDRPDNMYFVKRGKHGKYIPVFSKTQMGDALYSDLRFSHL